MPDTKLVALDAQLAATEHTRWQSFYTNRARSCPFFVPYPDENLVEWLGQNRIAPGRAVDLGCGHGRNAIHLAQQGFAVEGVDYSESALAWARERVLEAGVPVTLTQRSVFDLELTDASYDLVYDSGCFHHIAPHRRQRYVGLVARALKPGGAFGLVCFKPEGGSGLSDDEVYAKGTLGGGLGYTQQQLRQIWSPALHIELLRTMREPGPDERMFGKDFLWAMLARKA
jgi:SAM-dependent methyltransferase